MRTPLACDEDLVPRLPLPLAQLYRRAHNAKSALERHLTAFYLWEASLKLLATVAVVEYAEHPAPDPQVAERLKNLARPALGHWWEFARRLLPLLAEREDADLRRVRDLLLGRARDDLPRAAGLDAALREALTGQAGARATVRLTELFEHLVQYRNKELGHGAAGQRPGGFYEGMGRSLLAGVAEVLGRLDVLAGRRLLYVAEVRQAAGGWLVQRYELRGESARRCEPLELPRAATPRLPEAERLYLEAPGGEAPLLRSLHPLLTYDAETAEVFFLNARRDRQRTEYLSYTSGRALDRPDLEAEQRRLLARALNLPVQEAQTEDWAARSRAEEAPAEAGPPPAGGQRGEFELLSELGRGGMGKVYRAWQPSLGRQVALKELLRVGDARAEARFSREIRALGRVEHPNLVKIFTSGSEGDLWFYAMELLEGTPLSGIYEHLRRRTAATTGDDAPTWQEVVGAACREARQAEKPLADARPEEVPPPAAPAPAPAPGRGHVEQVVELVRQVAGAAHALHEAGIVHRDIKPGNILLTADGAQAVLMDLGLAQLADDEEGRLTRTRQFVGTLRYASPEQILAVRRLDRRSDVYSLGATLWELLTLRPLFGATEQMPTARLMEVVQYAEPERPRKYNPGCPADLEAVVLKCLEKDPARRYATAAELADDLGRWQRGEPVTAHPLTLTYLLGKVVRRYRGRLAVAACLLLAALAGAAVAFYRIDVAWREADRERGRAEAALATMRQEQQQRVGAQVDALLTADAASVPVLLEHLGPFRQEVAPRTRELLRRKDLPEERRLRASLLLLPDDPALVPYLRDRLLRADPQEVIVIRQALLPHRAKLKEGLWRLLEDRAAGAGPRLRAACALAAYDPADARWSRVRGDVAAVLVEQNPLSLGVWTEGLRPVRGVLLPALTGLYRHEGKEAGRYVLANLLAEYATDRVDDLADLIQGADGRQFAVLLPKLRTHGERATRLLSAALGTNLLPQWADPRPASSWPAPDPAVVRKIEGADGLVAERWALVQTMPLDDFKAAAEGLRAAGYRPIRLRPFAAGKVVRVAAVWQRDGEDWRMASGLSAAQVRERDGKLRGVGFAPVDVAGYLPGGSSPRAEERYAGLWARAAGAPKDVKLFVGLLDDALVRILRQKATEPYTPLTMQAVVGAGGAWRCSALLRKGGRPEDCWYYQGAYERLYETLLSPSNFQIDVSLTRAPAPPKGLGPYDEAVQLDATEEEVGPALLHLAQALAAPLRRGVTAFGRGEDRAAVAELSEAIKRFSVLPAAYDFRAMAHARLGEAAEARKDLAMARKYVAQTLVNLNPQNRLASTGWYAYADLVASTYLGEDQAAATRLEAFVAEKSQTARGLFRAACAYARAAAVLGGGPAPSPDKKARARRYADRAVALLERAVDHGLFADGGMLQAQPDLDSLRRHPGFVALLGRLHLERRYDAVWSTATADRVSESLHGLAPAAHLRRCRELAARGYRPAALAVAAPTDDGPLVAASIWHRPSVPEAAADALARRQSNAALALLRLGRPAEVWPLFRQRPDPRLRSYLIHGCRPMGIDPALLAEQLRQEGNPSARQALMLSLGAYAAETLPAALRQALVAELLTAYRGDPDPGVHGAVDWLLRQWGQGTELKRRDGQRTSKGPSGGRGWYVNGQGQTLAVVRGPVVFWMGSPATEAERQATETQHRVRIGRSFAIGTRAVTVQQFKRFRKAHFYNKQFSPADDGPVPSVTWLEAAQYCRWLSEQEKVPEDQMCFPRREQIKAGMALPPDYLKRTGYRLPTEAEWECACRAGTVTPCYHGHDPKLLAEYAWSAETARHHAWPVGQLKPNDWGLFDMLGNVGQWCMDLPSELYLALPGGLAVEDSPSPETGGYRQVRGGSFLTWQPQMRCATRFTLSAGNGANDVGFRVARTLPAPP